MIALWKLQGLKGSSHTVAMTWWNSGSGKCSAFKYIYHRIGERVITALPLPSSCHITWKQHFYFVSHWGSLPLYFPQSSPSSHTTARYWSRVNSGFRLVPSERGWKDHRPSDRGKTLESEPSGEQSQPSPAQILCALMSRVIPALPPTACREGNNSPGCRSTPSARQNTRLHTTLQTSAGGDGSFSQLDSRVTCWMWNRKGPTERRSLGTLLSIS